MFCPFGATAGDNTTTGELPVALLSRIRGDDARLSVEATARDPPDCSARALNIVGHANNTITVPPTIQPTKSVLNIRMPAIMKGPCRNFPM